MKISVPILVLLSPVFAAAAPLTAQSTAAPAAPEEAAATLRAVRVAAPPVLDGRLDDAAWTDAPVATGFVQMRPHPGAPASERTEVRVVYDDAALYVGVRLFDATPDSVVGRLARRDAAVYSDWFAVGVDSYLDRRTAFVFAVNPRGVKRDLLAHDDIREDAGWDAVWDVATQIDSLGWTAEFRIPFNQLRFAGSAGERRWGVNFERRIARRDEVSHWAPRPPDAAGAVSLYGTLEGLQGIRPPRGLEVKPYSVARVTRAPGDVADPFHRASAWSTSLGADVAYGVTSDLTLTATVNPDFGQVDADPAVVNLSAFETFLAERRPFFTEGAQIFATPGPRLFHSRRIGRRPQGSVPPGAAFAAFPEATTLLGAVKLSGKTGGGWSVGLMNAVTAPEHVRYVDADGHRATAPVEPLTNHAVARVSRDFRGGGTALGAVATAVHRRLGGEDALDGLRRSAYAGGVDARHRFGGGDYQVTAGLLGSLVQGSETAIDRTQRAPGRYFQRPDAGHLDYDPARTALAGYSARAAVARIGGGNWRWSVGGTAHSPGFEINDLGFHTGVDVVRQHATVGYRRHAPGRLFREWAVDVGQSAEWTYGGERGDAALHTYIQGVFRNHWGGDLWYMRHLGGLTANALRGGPATVWPGRHMGAVSFHTDRRRTVSAAAGSYWDVEDGTGSATVQVYPSVTVRASHRLELSARLSAARQRNTWQYVARRTDAHEAGAERYVLARLDQTTGSLTTRMDYAFTPNLTLQLYAQPFVSAGGYTRFREMADPRAATFDERFRPLANGEIRRCTPAGQRAFYGVRPNAGGCDASEGGAGFAYRVDDPDFSVRNFRSNAVVRWEYRPGSTLFAVWSQGRSQHVPNAGFSPGGDIGDLFRTPGTNVLLLKLSYWIGA